MKRTGMMHRVLAMLLVVVMTFQVLPMGVFATFGDLQGGATGVDLSTLGQKDAINWPIKVYDYLSDGMMFEWFDTNTDTYYSSTLNKEQINVGHTSGSGNITPYGGGYKPPVTALGSDFTYAASTNYSSSHHNSPYYYSSSGCAVSLKKVGAVDFKTPYHLRIEDNTDYSGSDGNHNMLLNYFSSDQSTKGNMRYMVLVYRANKVENYYCSISLSDDTGGNNLWDRNQVKIPDSSDWTYVIFDTSTWVSSSIVQWVWLTFHTTTGFNTSYKGMNYGAYLDLTHIGYFSDKTEAENYGAEAVKFDKNPGEYLAKTASFTETHSYVVQPKRSDYLNNIFSLNYCWKNKDTNPEMFDSESDAANVRYGLDFTTHSTENGWKTNGYTSNTFWSWSNGTTLSLKNTVNNVTKTENFSMSAIDVEQHTQTNGAQFVRLTSKNAGKILLSKFREDHQTVHEGYAPYTADVDYMVLVYRANGLTAADPFGLWAQGYLNSSSTDGNKTANFWKHAGLTNASDWTTAKNIKKLDFSGSSGWQYRIIELRKTIAECDTSMNEFDCLANLGLYLPEMSDGQSLDIAYVGYFKNNPAASDGRQYDDAVAFADAAKNYMNASVTVNQDRNTTKTYTANRVWYGGGNKSFGMLYSSGGGEFWPAGNSGGDSAGTDEYYYGYKFDTWMIGYRTNAVNTDSFNKARKRLVWDDTLGMYVKKDFTANYTGTNSTTFLPDAEGTTNNTYFFAASSSKNIDTKDVKFDGYNLLETVTSGVMTAGLLEGGLQTVTVDGVNYRVPVYRQETVEYIAYNLLYGLRIPQKNSSGDYNTRYIKGTPSTKYGGVDLNGDGQIGWINYDGDSRTSHQDSNGNWTDDGKETNEASVDLATALRHELKLTPRLYNSVNVLTTSNGVDATHASFIKQMGKYEDTLAKSQMLYGEFSDCRNAIDTAMDAAYYLLNNFFIANSYNQQQDDYDYLTLSSATVNALGHSGDAYVFDAGFATGKTASAGSAFTDDGTSKSAVVYSPYGSANGTGTISMEGVTGKIQFDYGTSSTNWTTRFPFLPITDAEGDFAGQTQSYYFLDDAQRVYGEDSNSYKDRNYNYAIASNGEFVYREEDDLFFEFEGDDDVYLFINGQLVLDIGGAHSITSVFIDVNDYVTAAAAVLKELEQYGYNKDMSIDQFDDWISAATLQYLDKEYNPTGASVTNPYSADKIAEFKRQHRLNLSDGQICQFDFYYMERHGWGANMRIVTNMHITDPSLSVEKSAYQFEEEIEYGGVIDPNSAVEYNFKLTNTGNQKLYNLNWRDDVLGVTMDPDNGLQVNPALDGIYTRNAAGEPLQAKDLTAIVSGMDANGNNSEFTVTFEEVNGDGGQAALKRFLKKLESNDGTASGFDDAEVTNAGSGLWVGASVQFCGIYYMLTPEQTEARRVDNTVYLTATTKIDPSEAGNHTLRSAASHRLYTNGFPIHYQWAGHSIFMNMEHLLEQAKIEAEKQGSQLSEYQNFFKNVTLSKLLSAPCDKFGRVGGDYSDFLTAHSDKSGHTGYLINYKKPGIYTFYLLLYMNGGKDKDGNTLNKNTAYNASQIASGYYAILRSQVFVADVKDSVYVLDYGLSTESLDVNGELFKNDYLFGPYGTIRAKLMGITGGQIDETTGQLVVNEPSFKYPEDQADSTQSGIIFDSKDTNRFYGPNGFFNANLAIPDEGKEIAYDANKGQYTVTGVGTVKLKAEVPTTDVWEEVYVHYWYDDGTSLVWPGIEMKKTDVGKYEVDIPADVTNVIINNKSAAAKTADLKITPGVESTIKVQDTYTTTQDGNIYDVKIETIVEEVTVHVKVPEGWGDVYLHHWHENGESTTLPGDQMTELDDNGYHTIQIHGDVTHMLINNGSTEKQTVDLTVYAGKEVWIEVGNTVADEANNQYDAFIKYTQSKGYTVRASVPKNWKDTVYLYYWHEGMTDDEMTWPGVPMTKGEAGWYTYDGLVPADVSQLIINDGKDGNNHQTVNITVTPGLDTWIMVENKTVAEGDNKGKYTAKVAYGSETASTGLTFTPTSFMDQPNNLWLAITIHSIGFIPSEIGTGVEIHDEAQMYKKITILPATVVYYEDTFEDINYIKSDTTTGNTFTHHGDGSGRLFQSIDQEMPYGQDPAYQADRNNLYSGQSMTKVQIKNTDKFATFTFKGTGFELIGRTNAFDSATTVARVYKAAEYYDGILDDYTAEAKEYQVYYGVVSTYEAALNAYNKVQTAYDAAVAARDAAEASYAETNGEGLTYEALYAAYEMANDAYDKAYKQYKNAMIAYEKAVEAYKEYHKISSSGSSSVTEEIVKPENLQGYTKPIAPETLIGAAIKEVAKPDSPMVRNVPVITQFDHGFDGGRETINQVPVLRVTDLPLDEYVVELSGVPSYTYDQNYNETGVADTYVYIDGLRIFQPMGATNNAYTAEENGAVVEEMRNLIINGMVGVGVKDGDGLKLSTGTVTWTENLPDNDFYAGNYETYEGIIVGDVDDYLMQGPNNEVYMEGNAAINALVFYVKETDANVHELQIAVRGLDYAKFYGAGVSSPEAQLQYGVLLDDGTYAWKNLARVVSGTEQYYTIPYSECPVDLQGRYQVALRVANVENGKNALVSYTSLKRNGLEVVKVEGLGETTILNYENGMLIKPEYELVIINAAFKDVEIVPFTGNELTMTLDREWTYVYIRSTVNGTVSNFYSKVDPGSATTATMYKMDTSQTRYSLGILKAGGEVTFKIKQFTEDMMELSYCQHTWDAGLVVEEADCCNTGIMAYTCTGCGHMKQEVIEKNGKHTYSDRTCIRCGAAEPDYYLVGYINGADYGCNGDWENVGEYKFVDGKLVATFNEISYVFVKKATDDPKTFQWFMSKSFVSDKTGAFYDTSTGTGEKMLVPGGVEVTFTLTEDGYGGLILSYSVPCDHNWDDGTVILAPTCTEEGEKEYYCHKCGLVRTEAIEMVDHNYKDGSCVDCGDIQMRNIYLLLTEEWEDAYAYAWTDATDETPKEEYIGGWPGAQMEFVSDEIARIRVPVNAKKIIFHNGTGSQTADLDIPTDGRDMYNMFKNEWAIRDKVVDYYLIGNINGANYGCEEDSANLGEYKFVNGELVATFEQDSYLFVKTTGNLNWYMTDGWMGDGVYPNTVTLYNTTTDIEHNKMMVPGGKQLTFTLVVNEDDTLTLTVHEWIKDTTNSKLPTCDEDGYDTYYCGYEDCSETKTVVLKATGHNYVDGVCQNPFCSTQKTHRIYYKNTFGWNTVNIYAWTDANSVTTRYTGEWPGSAMSYDAEKDLYYYDLPVNAMSVIFNNGTNQTSNLTVPQESDAKKVYYDYAKIWETETNVPEVPETPAAKWIYFVPSSNWKDAGARFAAYFFGGSNGTTWVDMTEVSSGVYGCQIPEGDYPKVIFGRMDPGNSYNDWTTKWNQTGNLTIPTDGNNCCYGEEGAWDGFLGSWGVYEPATKSITRSARMTGAMSSSSASEPAKIEVPDMYIASFGSSMNLYSVNRQMTSNIIYGELDAFVPGTSQPEQGETEQKLDLNSAMLQLSDDISVVFKADVPADATSPYMVFEFNGVRTTVTDYTVDGNGKYCYTFTGVNPQLMGDSINATLYAIVDGAVVSDTVADYSVLKYCTGMLNRDISDEFRTLISDLLVYGAKAQLYTGYKTDALVTEGLELNSSSFPGLDSSYDKHQTTGLRNKIHDVVSVSLLLSNNVAMKFGFVLDDPELYTYDVTINGETLTYTAKDLTYDADTNRYYLVFSEIYATEFDEIVTVVVKENGMDVSRMLAFSVNTYIYKNQNTDDAATRELLQAIFNYGKSAQAFVETMN